jgi:hypothetical protein
LLVSIKEKRIGDDENCNDNDSNSDSEPDVDLDLDLDPVIVDTFNGDIDGDDDIDKVLE